jgi:hypothetical protein
MATVVLQNHPMKPQRLTMAHHLILGYGLHKKMDVYVGDCTTSLMLACTVPH